MATRPATYHTVQVSQQQWDDAIEKIIEQIALQSNILSVEDAIESLILTGGQYAESHVHALYLQKVPESDGFTRKDVSIYLAELGENDELLTTYFQLVHFGGLSIETSLRLFYTKLKLKALMNKNLLNVLLTALARAYKTNGGNFKGDMQDAIRIYNAMIMLNDSLHNKNALGRSRQTEQSFLQIINDKNENNVYQFDEDEMRRIYHAIQRMPLQSTKQSMHTMQRSQPVTLKEVKNVQPKSYSKYGASKGNGRNDIIAIDANYTSVMKKNYGDEDINPNATQNINGGNSCCVVM